MTVALLIYSYITAVANQICQDGKCRCAPGFARNNDEECEGNFLELWWYTSLYNWAVKDFFIKLMISFSLLKNAVEFHEEFK